GLSKCGARGMPRLRATPSGKRPSGLGARGVAHKFTSIHGSPAPPALSRVPGRALEERCRRASSVCRTVSALGVSRLKAHPHEQRSRSLANKIGRCCGALAEEILLEFRHPDALSLLADQIETVLIDQHLRMLEPLSRSEEH